MPSKLDLEKDTDVKTNRYTKNIYELINAVEMILVDKDANKCRGNNRSKNSSTIT